jgi:ParB family chromosome partitioning protein
LVEQRRRRGKGFRSGGRHEPGVVSSTELLRTYRENVEKKRLLIRKSEICRDRLVFVTQALRSLFADENFVTLLRAKGLDTLPRNPSDRLGGGR